MEELLIQAVKNVNEKDILMLVDQAFATGYTPTQIIEILKKGMDCVGKEYEVGNYFIADLMMSGIIFKEILSQERMKPNVVNDKHDGKGTILVGTVKGDLHDIGKGLFSGMALSCGYDIVDLGVDVKPQTFVDQIKELKPQILALSGVLHTAIKSMKDTVDLIDENGLRDQIKIIVGGNPLTLETFHFIGADAYSRDAAEGINIIKSWMKAQE